MDPEYEDFDETVQERRKAVEESIRPISIEELRKMGGEIFPYPGHPWEEEFNAFLATHAADSFYHAQIQDGYHIIYCRNAERGLWYLPETAIGIIQKRGLAGLKEIVDQRHPL